MTPIHLSLTGFLSYRQRVEIDFSSFNLACIAGPNGAGKSSLLDSLGNLDLTRNHDRPALG